MGVCLSCFGHESSSDCESQARNRLNSERTPLLQDPTSILQNPHPPTDSGEDQQLDQAALQKIVDRTAENLIDIQSAFKKESEGDSIKYLIERLQTNGSSLSVVEADKDASMNETGSSQERASAQADLAPIVQSKSPITEEERNLLDGSGQRLAEALARVRTKKPVGDVVVKLSWD